jgi:MtN3 and saliva related transmembrane protein
VTSAAWIDVLGYAAAALTTAAFVPQVWHTLRTRDVSGISTGMYAVFTTGIALWLGYGLAVQAWPIVIANAITFVLALAILVLKQVIERGRQRSQSPPSPPPRG